MDIITYKCNSTIKYHNQDKYETNLRATYPLYSNITGGPYLRNQKLATLRSQYKNT